MLFAFSSSFVFTTHFVLQFFFLSIRPCSERICIESVFFSFCASVPLSTLQEWVHFCNIVLLSVT